jgi:hypothetical protein
MPLKKGKSKKVINSNIEELLHSYKEDGTIGTSHLKVGFIPLLMQTVKVKKVNSMYGQKKKLNPFLAGKLLFFSMIIHSLLLPDLIARKMEITDNVTPSSNSEMALSLFLLGNYYNIFNNST